MVALAGEKLLLLLVAPGTVLLPVVISGPQVLLLVVASAAVASFPGPSFSFNRDGERKNWDLGTRLALLVTGFPALRCQR